MKQFIKLGVLALALIIISSCKKDTIEPTTPIATTTDNVLLKIEHNWNDTVEFNLNSTFIQPDTGDTLSFTTFKYYISNIRLKKDDGSWWTQPDSYFLLNIEDGSTPSVTLSNVPFGEYTDIEYVLGVDSLHNVSGAQGGALAASNGMFWSWNTGYIMLKAEGTSPNSSSNSFAFHLGGFAGTNNVVTTKTHNFVGNSLSVTGNGNCQIHLSAAPQSLWETSPSVSSVSNLQMPGSSAKTMALNFYNSVQFEHIHE